MRVSPILYSRLFTSTFLRQGVFTDVGESVSQAASLSRIHRGIKEYGTNFSERAQVIIQGLQSHPDLDCRFLGTMLSFSDFYKLKKEQQKS
jgi:gamma-tubulin complex component 3